MKTKATIYGTIWRTGLVLAGLITLIGFMYMFFFFLANSSATINFNGNKTANFLITIGSEILKWRIK